MAGDFPNLSSDMVSQWPSANVENPITRSWYLEFSIVIAIITTTIFSARMWSQIRKSTNGLGVDDGFACLGWVFASLFTGVAALGTMKYGFDRHMWDVPGTLFRYAALVEWLSEGAFILSTCFTKISVLCFFCRLEPPCTRALKRIIYVFMAFTVGYTVACLLVQILLCRPITAYWDVPKSPGSIGQSCARQHIYYLLQGLLGSFSTFYSTMIPFLTLRNLPMSKFQRIGLRVVALLGFCVLGIGIARTVFLSRFANSANGDATWNAFNVFVFSQLECQLSLLTASLPYLQRYISQYPSVPIVYIYPQAKDRIDSVLSRVNSSRRFTRSTSPRTIDISTPQMVEIPEWEFDSLESPRQVHAPHDEITYDLYVQGRFGPTPPPKDSREMFYHYRKEHGEMA